MNRIHQANPAGGFASVHSRFCCRGNGTPCEEDATHHVRDAGWCGNVCGSCAKKFLAKHPKAEITDSIYIGES